MRQGGDRSASTRRSRPVHVNLGNCVYCTPATECYSFNRARLVILGREHLKGSKRRWVAAFRRLRVTSEAYPFRYYVGLTYLDRDKPTKCVWSELHRGTPSPRQQHQQPQQQQQQQKHNKGNWKGKNQPWQKDKKYLKFHRLSPARRQTGESFSMPPIIKRHRPAFRHIAREPNALSGER
ncbi:hypothetical protein LSH36_44g03004 [Paralvinella palmiformis]|uniref:Uncharacterized protein n=1 Tax=Paralvinella palmiformis TaxID=53620 RepID=A0AAD9K7J8_9ANNE|nr:hypothetical protein LSH36_44g03004 [Paralvinella palmiformis]